MSRQISFLIFFVTLQVVLAGGAPGAEASSDGTPSNIAQATQATAGEERLRVLVGKSMVLNSPDPLKRISVTDPEVASAMIISPNQVLINGQRPGSVTLILWNEDDIARPFSLDVEPDIEGLRETLKRVLPDQQIDVRQSGASLVLTGTVDSEVAGEQAVALAQTHTENVVSLLSQSENRQVVMLKVRFAEVDRDAIQQLGMNVFSTGAGNTFGSISTQQFGQTQANVGAVPSNVERGRDPQSPNLASGAIGNQTSGSPGVFGLSDLLNVFLFRPDVNLGLTLKALQHQNLLQILAEPNVMALNGKEASFLAGGEFPFPVVQGGTNFTAVTIMFKEFGVRLKFTPEVMEDGMIRLKVAPEVSALDFSNALTISGFLVPAISTRRAETEIELRNGQSFAIAGLMDNRVIENLSKVPLLGDIPFFGKLFRSRSIRKNSSELMVMITPILVGPTAPGEAPGGPEFPEEFLDPNEFDGQEEEQRGDSQESDPDERAELAGELKATP